MDIVVYVAKGLLLSRSLIQAVQSQLYQACQ